MLSSAEELRRARGHENDNESSLRQDTEGDGATLVHDDRSAPADDGRLVVLAYLDLAVEQVCEGVVAPLHVARDIKTAGKADVQDGVGALGSSAVDEQLDVRMRRSAYVKQVVHGADGLSRTARRRAAHETRRSR
jgi:hypothetical protein